MSKKLVLQVGEGTHTHVLETQREVVHTQHNGDILEMLLEGTGVVSHEEHAKMVLPQGKYFKFPQMEYDPIAGNLRQVFD